MSSETSDSHPKARVAKKVTIIFIGPLGWDTQFVFFESCCNLVRWNSGKHEDLFDEKQTKRFVSQEARS